MAPTDFSGRDVVKVLRSFGYRPIGRAGSHVRLRYVHPADDETRLVTVPMHDRIKTGTLRAIAEQCAVLRTSIGGVTGSTSTNSTHVRDRQLRLLRATAIAAVHRSVGSCRSPESD